MLTCREAALEGEAGEADSRAGAHREAVWTWCPRASSRRAPAPLSSPGARALRLLWPQGGCPRRPGPAAHPAPPVDREGSLLAGGASSGDVGDMGKTGGLVCSCHCSPRGASAVRASALLGTHHWGPRAGLGGRARARVVGEATPVCSRLFFASSPSIVAGAAPGSADGSVDAAAGTPEFGSPRPVGSLALVSRVLPGTFVLKLPGGDRSRPRC